MKLTIQSTGTSKFPFLRIMNGDEEFCSTRNREYAILIQQAFAEIDPNPDYKRPELNAILDMENNGPAIEEKNEEFTKEKDLDNDGVPDRIDINDNDNSVQTSADYDIRHEKTNKTNKTNEKDSKPEEKESRKIEQVI